MLIVLIIILVVIFVATLMYDNDGVGIAMSLLALLAGIIAFLIVLGFVINGRVIDDKIEMYEEENTKIETSISELVEQYMSYESDTLIELKNESSVVLVSLYPELKSDELIKAQIELYSTNNQKIKELREKKLNISNYKWWLYFGK